MRKEVISISDGTKYHFLTVGPIVFDVCSHPLYLTTPISYVAQGAVRECTCECGNQVLYSENALVSGRVKSCGCLRKARNEKAHQEKLVRDSFKLVKKEILLAIQQAQQELRVIQASVGSAQRNKDMDAVAMKLRKLFALKGYANRKDTPRDTVAHKLREIKDER